METKPTIGYPAETGPAMSLQLFVNSLVDNSLSVALDNCSSVINEVGKGVVLQTSNARILSLIEEVFNTVIVNSRKGDIHISAENNEGRLVLKIQERNNYNGYALSFSIGTLVSDFNFAGGSLDINSPQQKVTTIILSFPDRKAA